MSGEDRWAKERLRMVKTQIEARGIKDFRVLEAMRRVPRHLFVDEDVRDQAYGDFPLPIGEEQTISQPYIVALMTEALELRDGDVVLEIGTGSGYQAAILAELTRMVYSIERFPRLVERARRVLAELGYDNVEIKQGDGTLGWPEKGPFDAIIVTAGAPRIPQPLIEQLKVGGRLVIPIGDRYNQDLIKVLKTEKGHKEKNLGGCRFVNLVGRYGWEV